MREEFTVDGLVAAAALAVSAAEIGTQSGRVGDVPGLRSVRYYTTVGLIDRPLELRGRTAFYGRRHLLQLVSIKRLQARGLSLVEVQQQLYGLPNEELERLARIPVAGPSRTPRHAFWKERPEPPSKRPPATNPAVRPTTALALSPELVLVWPAERPLDDADRQAILAAAAPLLRLLQQRRLVRTNDPRRDDL